MSVTKGLEATGLNVFVFLSFLLRRTWGTSSSMLRLLVRICSLYLVNSAGSRALTPWYISATLSSRKGI